MQKLEKLIRKDLQKFSAYSSAKSLKVQGDIWLNANESPFNDENLLNRYPSPQPQKLVQRLADIYKVKTDNLLVTRGSDEGIDLLFRLFCEYQKDTVFAIDPTFAMYKVAAQLQGVEYKSIKLKQEADFNLDISELLESIPNNCKLLFLCTPNNPTGKLLSLADIEKVLAKLVDRCIVVVDEAYIEFTSEQSATTLIDKYQNLVVLRTLSKAFGMAGLRLGAVISNTTTIEWLRKILAVYPIPRITETIVLNLLDDESLAKLDRQVQEIKQQRQLVFEKLEKLAIVKKVYLSDANFLLVNFKKGVFDDLIANKIVVRSMEYFFNDEKFLRISIGTAAENKKLIKVLEGLS